MAWQAAAVSRDILTDTHDRARGTASVSERMQTCVRYLFFAELLTIDIARKMSATYSCLLMAKHSLTAKYAILWTTSSPYLVAGSKAEKEIGHALKLAICEMAKIGSHGTHACELD